MRAARACRSGPARVQEESEKDQQLQGNESARASMVKNWWFCLQPRAYKRVSIGGLARWDFMGRYI